MEISALSAWVFLPFAVPIGLYVAFTDLKSMKIRNHAVLALLAVFVVAGVFVLPFGEYLWRFSHLVVLFAIGFVLTAGGIMGAGDAKFMAVAAPFVALGDAVLMLMILATAALAAFAVHRLARATALRRLAPDWESWTAEKFPMGFALGPALIAYLGMGAAWGS
ncbi:prepilin peptidase [Pseudaestuariivita atlantica]|uniref:Membrane protein n=1 Tax=Pseudaestuariivita atlantica TaxID=1317121 RepID=A0A0L1JSR7_9RHOB|nr:prepilin peptidase [Pseudaestuariivita atlantica]KNG94800.1 membrane protein [Pseudaestuariivita atlantica]